ncbi:transcriptional regulator [Pseudonocardiaceae bacterium YIM PH 21723]|nr:transcriptional regulator [Pseudonocardiaceae bacterium YIM PH 21723]
MSLSARLTALGEPSVLAQLDHPTLRGIADGTLDPEVFRSWLEQDYLFLLDYVRVFSRLAWQAPDEHLGDLVDLAHNTWHEELRLHRGLAAEFGAMLDIARKGPACAGYSGFLLDSAADYGTGLAAMLPCMWGYSEIGQRLAHRTPADSRYAAWVGTYSDPAFAALAARCAQMLDEAHAKGLVTEEAAEAAFRKALDHELAFWDVP